MNKKNKIILITTIASVVILTSIGFPSVYNYYVYTIPIKNAILDINGHYDYSPINATKHMMSIEKISLLPDNSINVQFGENDYEWSNGYKPFPEFSYSTNIKVNDVFLIMCHDYKKESTLEFFPDIKDVDKTGIDFLQYLGIITENGNREYKFYHVSARTQNYMPCNFPEVIDNSFNVVKIQDK